MNINAIARFCISDLDPSLSEESISQNVQRAILQNDIQSVFAYAKLAYYQDGQSKCWAKHAVSWFLMLYKSTPNISARVKRSYILSMLQWAISSLFEDCQQENGSERVEKPIKLMIQILIGCYKTQSIRRSDSIDYEVMSSCIKVMAIFLTAVTSGGTGNESGHNLSKQQSHDLNKILSSSLFTQNIIQTYEIFIRLLFHIHLCKPCSWSTKFDRFNQLLVYTMKKECTLSWIALYVLCEQIYLFSLENFGEQHRQQRTKVQFQIRCLVIRICGVIPRQFLTQLHLAINIDKDSQQLLLAMIDWDIIDLFSRMFSRPADKEQLLVLVNQVIEKLPKLWQVIAVGSDLGLNQRIQNYTANLLKIKDNIESNRHRSLFTIFKGYTENSAYIQSYCIMNQSYLKTYFFLIQILRNETIHYWFEMLKKFTSVQIIQFIIDIVFQFNIQESEIVYLLMKTAQNYLMGFLNDPEEIKENTITSISLCCIALSIFNRSITKPLFLCKHCYTANKQVTCMNCRRPCRIFKCQVEEKKLRSIQYLGESLASDLIDFIQNKIKFVPQRLHFNLITVLKSLEKTCLDDRQHLDA